jgi:hypothetical protein
MQSYTTRADGSARTSGDQNGCCTSEIDERVPVQASSSPRLARSASTWAASGMA